MTVVSYRNPRTGRPSPRVTPAPQTTIPHEIASPIGMDAMTPLGDMTEKYCRYTYNLLPYELGLQTRQGYREFASDPTPAGQPFRTIIPFNGVTGSNDRLWAANDQGLYRVDLGGTIGAAEITWPTTGAASGYCTWAHFVNDAGAEFLLLADEQNGYYVYTESTGLWTKMTTVEITGGVDPDDIYFLTIHKNRVWLVAPTGTYYLPANAFQGAATKFNIEANFREGGAVTGLYSWTIDGGDGVDDYFVAISREGGIVIYRGNDPAQATSWAQVGVWYVGRVPVGNRVGSQYGGQLFVLSEQGLINLNRLIEGSTIQNASIVSTDRITRLVREDVNANIEVRGWEMKQHPTQNHFMIMSPDNGNTPRIQYVRNMTTNGWGLARGLPIATGDVFRGHFYFADPGETKIWVLDGSLDAQNADGTGGLPVAFSMLTGYQGSPTNKKVEFIRPYFLATQPPSFDVQARYDFALDENTKNVSAIQSIGAKWDVAKWDNAVWSSGQPTPSEALRGASGYGHQVAIALRGECTVRTTLVQFDMHWQEGGLL